MNLQKVSKSPEQTINMGESSKYRFGNSQERKLAIH